MPATLIKPAYWFLENADRNSSEGRALLEVTAGRESWDTNHSGEKQASYRESDHLARVAKRITRKLRRTKVFLQ